MASHRKTTRTRISVGTTIERREFLRLMGGAVALGAGFPPFSVAATHRHGMVSSLIRGGLATFVDALPVPSVIAPVGRLHGAPYYDVVMRQVDQKLHRDMRPTTVWGYNGLYPGPTFEARRGVPIAVQWQNDLPAKHALPLDHTLHGAGANTPEVRTVVHVHGAKVLPDSDGYSEAWFTKDFAQTGPFFTTRVSRYPNDQPATGLWYHDHALGITRLNLFMGLEGLYFIRDKSENELNLPKGPYEIPLMIQDRSFNADGSLLYPVQELDDPEIPPVWVPEFFGDTVLVNGKVWPYLEVEPRKYRFRLLNASNARFYHLTLNEATADGVNLGKNSLDFNVIGTDGGFLPAPVRLHDLTIAPAERFDIIIDFSEVGDKFFVLNNDAKAPFPDGDDVIPTDVMLFKVTKHLSGRDTSAIPSRLPAGLTLDAAKAVSTRDLVLVEHASAGDEPIEALINAHWDEPLVETPRAGSTEIWRIINTTGDAHPIHLHLVQFNILDRQAFDVEQYPAQLVFTGPRVSPPPEEQRAAKDTVKAAPGEVTRFVAKFDLPTGTPTKRGQQFVYTFHCHILEHEDNQMMRPYAVMG